MTNEICALIAAIETAHQQISACHINAVAGSKRSPHDDEWQTMAGCYNDALTALAPAISAIADAKRLPLLFPGDEIVLTQPPTILVTVREGLVADVACTVPAKLICCDYDVEGTDPVQDMTFDVAQPDGTTEEALMRRGDAGLLEPAQLARLDRANLHISPDLNLAERVQRIAICYLLETGEGDTRARAEVRLANNKVETIDFAVPRPPEGATVRALANVIIAQALNVGEALRPDTLKLFREVEA